MNTAFPLFSCLKLFGAIRCNHIKGIFHVFRSICRSIAIVAAKGTSIILTRKYWISFPNMKYGFAAMGDGGNTIYVNMKKGMAVPIASLLKPKIRDRIELIRKCIEPLFSS